MLFNDDEIVKLKTNVYHDDLLEWFWWLLDPQYVLWTDAVFVTSNAVGLVSTCSQDDNANCFGTVDTSIENCAFDQVTL